MRLPTIVLDTNVVVSAHLNEEGYEASVLILALARKLVLATSEAILAEYRQVLHREKFQFDPDRIEHSLRLIRAASRRVKPRHALEVASDPADNRFLECAEEAGADYLVTGNKRHFPKRWRKTRVVNARELVEIISPKLER